MNNNIPSGFGKKIRVPSEPWSFVTVHVSSFGPTLNEYSAIPVRPSAKYRVRTFSGTIFWSDMNNLNLGLGIPTAEHWIVTVVPFTERTFVCAFNISACSAVKEQGIDNIPPFPRYYLNLLFSMLCHVMSHFITI